MTTSKLPETSQQPGHKNKQHNDMMTQELKTKILKGSRVLLSHIYMDCKLVQNNSKFSQDEKMTCYHTWMQNLNSYEEDQKY